MGARQYLAAALKAAVPKTWDVIEFPTDLENPRHVTVVIRPTSVKRTKGAPRMFRDEDFSLALVEPGLDSAQVETALEASLNILLEILDGIDILVWIDATRATYNGRFSGYDITITITTEKG